MARLVPKNVRRKTTLSTFAEQSRFRTATVNEVNPVRKQQRIPTTGSESRHSNGTVNLMNCCRVVFINVCLMMCVVSTSAAANEPHRIRAAVAAMFNDEHVQQEALHVHLQAAAMAAETRFAFLSRWVLPSEEHDSLRMQIDFTQSYPAPVVARRELPPGRMIASGADLIAPAVDLVNVAMQLNRLEQIRAIAESWNAADSEKLKSRAAFLSIIAIAQKDLAAADTHGRELLELTTSLPVTQSERGPEAIVVWFARLHNAIREVASDLAVRLFDDVQVDKGRPTERWKRHIFATKYAIETSIVGNASSELPIPQIAGGLTILDSPEVQYIQKQIQTVAERDAEATAAEIIASMKAERIEQMSGKLSVLFKDSGYDAEQFRRGAAALVAESTSSPSEQRRIIDAAVQLIGSETLNIRDTSIEELSSALRPLMTSIIAENGFQVTEGYSWKSASSDLIANILNRSHGELPDWMSDVPSEKTDRYPAYHLARMSDPTFAASTDDDEDGVDIAFGTTRIDGAKFVIQCRVDDSAQLLVGGADSICVDGLTIETPPSWILLPPGESGVFAHSYVVGSTGKGSRSLKEIDSIHSIVHLQDSMYASQENNQ